MRAKGTKAGLTWAGRGQGERHERRVWKGLYPAHDRRTDTSGRRGPAHEVKAVLSWQHTEARLTAELNVLRPKAFGGPGGEDGRAVLCAVKPKPGRGLVASFAPR